MSDTPNPPSPGGSARGKLVAIALLLVIALTVTFLALMPTIWGPRR